MKKLLFTLLLITSTTPLFADIIYNFVPAKNTTRLVTNNDLPTGLAEYPHCYGFVSGELDQINFMNYNHGHTISLRIGGIYYLATHVYFNSTAPINFHAENIGGFTLLRNDDAPTTITNKTTFKAAIRSLMEDSSFVASSTHHNLRVNGFCPSKDLRFYDTFKVSRRTEFCLFTEYGNVEAEQCVMTYSATTHKFKVLQITHTDPATYLSEMMETTIHNDGKQTVHLRSDNGTNFALVCLGHDFDMNEDIPQLVFTLEAEVEAPNTPNLSDPED